MEYALLVYHEETQLRAMSREEMVALDKDSLAYDGRLAAEGSLIMAQALQSAAASKCIKVRKGKRLVTDGPFAETKEQLLGFVLIKANDLDEALEIAAGIPLASMGTVEVRAFHEVPRHD